MLLWSSTSMLVTIALQISGTNISIRAILRVSGSNFFHGYFTNSDAISIQDHLHPGLSFCEEQVLYLLGWCVCVKPVTKRYFYRSWFCILSSQVQTWSTEGIVACVCLLSLLKLLEMVMVPESLDAYSKLGTWEFHVDFLLFERNVYVLMHEGLVFVVIDALEMLCNFIR